jgi:hypothetical protein
MSASFFEKLGKSNWNSKKLAVSVAGILSIPALELPTDSYWILGIYLFVQGAVDMIKVLLKPDEGGPDVEDV